MEAPTFTCLSCAQRFDSAEAQREHFKMDWHRYNLKRKIAGVAPISEESFNSRRAAAQVVSEDTGRAKSGGAATTEKTVFVCRPCRMEFATLNAFNSHARSRRHKAKAAESASASGSRAAASGDAADDAAADEPVEDDDEEGEEVLDEPEVVVRSTVGSGAPAPASARPRGGHRSESKREATADDSDGGDGGDGDGDGDDDGDDDDEGEGEDSGLTPLHCVYCSRVSADIESNLSHMTVEHSFFIPDVEYLSDLEGFILYLVEKTTLARLCITCNRGFETAEAAHQHMADKGHTMIKYETEDDMDEFDEFYDFTPVISADGEVKALPTAAELRASSGVRVTDSGELVLPDGRIVGHRQYSRYYRQKYAPEDTRVPVIVTKLALEFETRGMKTPETSTALAIARAKHRHEASLSGRQRAAWLKPAQRFEKGIMRRKLTTGLQNNKLQGRYFRIQVMQ